MEKLFQHLKQHGKGTLMIVGDCPEVFTSPFYDQLLAQSGIFEPVYQVSLLDRKLPITPPVFNNREFFYTKGQAYKVNSPEIKGAYPTSKISGRVMTLSTEISLLKPKAILAFGPLALWSVTGMQSLTNYRGSELKTSSGIPVLATHSPLALQIQPELRFDCRRDLKRLKESLDQWGQFTPNIQVAKGYQSAMRLLDDLETKSLLVMDLETQARSQITCIGFGTSPNDATVIPFFSKEFPLGYYTKEEEITIVNRIKSLLTNPNIQIAYQNGNYDRQWTARIWGFLPRMDHDTLIAQAVLYPGFTKGLDYLSSHYCQHHIYWKNQLKEWKTNEAPDSTLFDYNGTDNARTFEILQAQLKLLESRNLLDQYNLQIANANLTIKIIMRGIKRNETLVPRADGTMVDMPTFLMEETQAAMDERIDWLQRAVPLEGEWWNSSAKTMHLCYEIFGLDVIKSRATHRPTVGKDALPKLAKKEPILQPILKRLKELHSLKNIMNVLKIQPDPVDNRYHSELTVCGAKTFRYTSHSDAFGIGTNNQNLSSGREITL